MSSAIQPHTIGVVGPGPNRQFVFERLLLRPDFVAADDCLLDTGSLDFRAETALPPSSGSMASDDQRTQIIYFAGPTGADVISAALQQGKHVVLSPASAMQSADELRKLGRIAAENRLVAVVDEPRRWEDDFRSAMAVVRSGHLGDLLRIRLSILATALPGEEFPHGLLWELGWHWLDQLLVFVDDELLWARLRQFHPSETSNDAGFLATMEFSRGMSVVIELQAQSLLSLRTGWLLEGTTGAYRAGRQYTKTPDGEIIDEQVSLISLTNDPFFDSLGRAVRGEKDPEPLPDLFHAARIAELIESLHRPF